MIDVLNYKLYGDVTVYDIIVVIVVMALATIIAKLITTNLRRALIDKMKRDQLELMLKVIYFGIIIVAFIAVLPALGLDLSGLLVAGGITGIVLGFASQSVVANLVSGIFLISEKPIKIGDQVNIDGVAGFVEDVNILSTIIRTYDGLYVRIPNEKVFTSNITNYVAHIARRFEYVVGIRYSDDAEKAIEIIKRIIEEHPFALKNPEPVVFVDNLGDSSVNIVVRIWAPSTEWYSVKMELLWKIKTELEKNGIEIPFPQRVVWFANELRANVEGKEEGRQA
ncbi:MAG: putative MscS family protein [Archaeoglobus fulgidus]|uniref:Putative MscS family protein n=1 Tax=Archaeoglobus fulgidus TaxID=2234 RepID=A0A117KME9_ARCFL|nr:mechanosensitive ion channel family protein [Archaeoglobus fulgidus]KUJ94186.1 MAG: putative MscS family protein [Archaeoglobus fulgidus]KUK05451.1 MAG: putative MscS family protein [Archaeoglobus fulgidus]